MATSKKVSPKRRKSIAGVNQNRPSLVPKNRRRAHSIVPGSLSPLAKARRSLAPRKSILKASVNILNLDSSSQNATGQPGNADDGSATRSLDVTMDFTAPVNPAAARKSLGRRVSFASHSHIRMFDTDNTNSTASPQSSPGSASGSPAQPSQLSNENDYPGIKSSKRRSSIRYSIAGSEDMDMTTVIPPMGPQRGSAILDEEFEDFGDEDDLEPMEETEAIAGNLSRRRSTSANREPLGQLQIRPGLLEQEADTSQMSFSDQSLQSEGVSEEQSRVMEFTVPLGQSLRPPVEQDEAWLALKNVTHSANDMTGPNQEDSFTNDENAGMDLDDAVARLNRARDSLGQASAMNAVQDDSFTSTEDSFEEDDNDGNKTLNLSRILGRSSMAGEPRVSMGYDSNMDESEIYGDIGQANHRLSLAPSHHAVVSETNEDAPVPVPATSTSSVFRPPPSSNQAQEASSKGANPFVFKLPPASPKVSSESLPKVAKGKVTFSAAFAPPVSRPSPRKPTTPSTQPSPSKRPRIASESVLDGKDDRRQSIASKWLDATGITSESQSTPSSSASRVSAPKGRPLSPSKKALFEPVQSKTVQPSLRQPSGYFARRKSLAATSNTSSGNEALSGPTKIINEVRLSLGAAPASSLRRVDGDAVPSMKEAPSSHSSQTATQNVVEMKSPLQGTFQTPQQVVSSPYAPSLEPPVNQMDEMSMVLSSSVQPSSNPETRSGTLREDQELDEARPANESQLSEEMDIDLGPTQDWRQSVHQANYDDGEETEEEKPDISIAQFFAMTGIKFMDELTAPRRSIHPSQQPIRQPRSPADIPLADYVTAMAIDVPQLELYSRVSKDLEAWMSKSKVVFAQAEDEAGKVTPELFVEYVRADEEGQAELLHQLNLIRTHTRYLARSDWYDWKHKWIEGLRVTADDAFASLEKDARALEGLRNTTEAIIPALEQEYEELLRELEHDKAEVEEIENSDQIYLNDLKASVAEQNIVIEALRAELAESNEHMASLQRQTNELDSQKLEARSMIDSCQRVLQMKQTSTRTEIYRIKGELEALEDLNMYKILKVNADLFEFVYSSLFHVSIPCRNFVPIVEKVQITRFKAPSTRYKDDFPSLSNFLLSMAQHLINEGNNSSVRQIVQQLADYWSSCLQLRSHLTTLTARFPVEIVFPESDPTSFSVKATVIFPQKEAKAYITFPFLFDTFSRWPMSLPSLDCTVDVVYGQGIEPSVVINEVISHLSEMSPSQNFACLLDACVKAQERYSKEARV